METNQFWQAVDEVETQLIETHKDRVRKWRETNDENFLEGQNVPSLVWERNASCSVDGRASFQKRGGSQFVFWLMSVDNIKPYSVKGHVTEAHARLAAQGIINHTHRLATAAEVAHHLNQRREHGELVRKMEQNREKKLAGMDPLLTAVKQLVERGNDTSSHDEILKTLTQAVALLAAQSAAAKGAAMPAEEHKGPGKAATQFKSADATK